MILKIKVFYLNFIKLKLKYGNNLLNAANALKPNVISQNFPFFIKKFIVFHKKN